MRHDRQDKATEALEMIHKEDITYDPSEDIAEMLEDLWRENESAGSWKEVFTDRVEIRKLMCTVGILGRQQIAGIQFVAAYSTVFIQDIGLSNGFVVTTIIYVVEVVGAFIALFLIDRYGRRPLLLPTCAIMASQMFVIGCLDIKQPRSIQVDNGIVSMIILFVLFFCLASGPLAWVVATESCVGRNSNRIIMTLGTFSFWLTAWVVTFTLPYLYVAIGPKLCFIYAGLCSVYFFFIYFCIGETVGKSIEEINQLFRKEGANDSERIQIYRV